MNIRRSLLTFLALIVAAPIIAISYNKAVRAGFIEALDDASNEAKAGPEGQSWARRQLDSMSLDEKIGQLFMIAAYSNKNEAHYAQIEKLVREENIGGLIFMQGGPGRQISLINRYQTAAKYPLLISQDAEWGISMRLDSTVRYPRNMTLGAIRDSLPLFELGLKVGQECRKVGVHVNFAPVVDVNNNPLNPVINTRSYGENPQNVATKGIYFYKGMEYAGVIGCAKHFPGHGDTDTDSHKDLPIIPHDRARLDSIELYPFREMFRRGAASVMVAHLYIPSLDDTENLASTLSPKIVTDLLKEELGFRGLVFTDALGMKGVTKFWEEGETDLKAFLAGNDVLLFSGNVPKAKAMIKAAIEKGEVSEAELNRRVLKILVAKEWAGLSRNRITPQVYPGEMDRPEARALLKRLYRQSMTLVRNEGNLLPFRDLEKRNFAVVEVGAELDAPFFRHFRTYVEAAGFTLPAASDSKQRTALVSKLEPYNTVVVVVDGMKNSARQNFGISQGTKDLIKNLREKKKQVAVVLLGSPYALKNFGQYEDAILVAYESNEAAEVAAAEALMGAIPVNGILPVTASAQFPEGTSLEFGAIGRYVFDQPEAAGMDSETLNRIDSIANAAVAMEATPGCAVLVMRHNKVVFHKGYGKTEYGAAGVPVDPYSTLYDLASVTKVAATTVTTMKLAYEDKIDVESPIAAYLADFREKEMLDIKVRNLLLHNAGFTSWIPFYRSTFDSTGKALRDDIYATAPTDEFCVPVIDGLYMCTDYQDSMWVRIMDHDLKADSRVKYSDLSMIVMRRVIESVTGQSFDHYVDSVFYAPMGMFSTCFNPALNRPDKLCAPTEMDNYWRNKKVQGYVHDQAAAMYGGVSGHAGLFSNVYDLAKLMLMVKDGGSYGGLEYFKPSTVKKFTTKQLTNSRKALGWDRPEPAGSDRTPCSQYASQETFGHLGFTGICVWVDPKYDLVYIFLSNRTFPSAENKKLIRENIRPLIHDRIYESIFAYRNRI